MGSSTSKASSSSSASASSTSSSPSPAIHKAFSFPTPLVHHPPARKGDTHHLVSLTSTSYGSLLLRNSSDHQETPPRISVSDKNNTDPVSRDSFSPDSVINTWELMDGLDDEFGFEISKPGKVSSGQDPDFRTKPDPNRNGSALKLDEEFEFEIPKPGQVSSGQDPDFCTKPDPNRNGSALKLDGSYELVRIEEDWVPLSFKPKQPLWKHLSEESFLSGLDPTIVSSYKKALSSKQLTNVRTIKSLSCVTSEPKWVCSKPRLQGAEDKIVLYFTTLRGIRKTYEDCCCVRMILRGLQVAVDERDISMDSKYRKELQGLLGDVEKPKPKPVCLPQVFIRGSHIGGVEEIMKLNDSGELAEMLKGFPACECLGTCRSCGDARFVPCGNCDGSTKVFVEEEERFKRCLVCNENGLVRCLECCH